MTVDSPSILLKLKYNLAYADNHVRATICYIPVIFFTISRRFRTDAEPPTSSNGLEYPSQSVFSTQRTKARGEPWCPRQWPPILSHEDGPGQVELMKWVSWTSKITGFVRLRT